MSDLPPDSPNGPLNLALSSLVESVGVYQAYSATARTRNTQSLRKDIPAEVANQRETVLDIACRVLRSEALTGLDKACADYLKARGK